MNSVPPAIFLRSGKPAFHSTLTLVPSLSVNPSRKLTAANGFTPALPPALGTAGYALGPIRAMVLTPPTSMGSRFPSFLSSTMDSRAAWSATRAPALL